jgi:MYXO-CTERM domain-containing protein
MRTQSLSLSLLASVALAGIANAGLAFSFSDPVPGRQLTNVQGNQYGLGTGHMSYDQFATLALFVDGSSEANPFTHMFSNARMEMSMAIYTGSTVGGVFSAATQGFFRIYDATTGEDIVRGDATSGAFLRVAGTSSLLLSSDSGFTYTFGAALQAALASSGNAGQLPVDPQEAVFTITDAITSTGSTSIIGAGGAVKSFTANASYSGNVETAAVPAPGTAALVGLAGLVTRRRRA